MFSLSKAERQGCAHKSRSGLLIHRDMKDEVAPCQSSGRERMGKILSMQGVKRVAVPAGFPLGSHSNPVKEPSE